MMKRQAGFTLVELLITMVVFLLVIAAASNIFTHLLTQFKQQSKIAETNIEGIVGLEILKQDIEHAGYGLPWNVMVTDGSIADSDGDGNLWEDLPTYSEGATNPYGLNDAPSDAPRAIISANNATYSSPNDIFDGSDYLIIKGVNNARNDACQRWTTQNSSDAKRTWGSASDDPVGTDRVFVMSPGSTDLNSRSLVVSGGSYVTTFGSTGSFAPSNVTDTHIIYGINDTGASFPIRPFNRSDYYIERPATNMPQRCAPNTGVLYKAALNQNLAGTLNFLPLLDCVADMQVIFGLDNDNDGDFEPGVSTDNYSDDISALTAQQIRTQLKQVRVYILAHEGQRDPNYTYPSTTIDLGGDVGLGRTFNLATAIPNFQNYRWKLYTLAIKPKNLR
jgi:prepilin-type N-terminal cleavage/methylation domain-containing protein